MRIELRREIQGVMAATTPRFFPHKALAGHTHHSDRWQFALPFELLKGIQLASQLIGMSVCGPYVGQTALLLQPPSGDTIHLHVLFDSIAQLPRHLARKAWSVDQPDSNQKSPASSGNARSILRTGVSTNTTHCYPLD
ncbi:MAG: hypothetical protein IPK95_12155 [Cellvibrionales bacterium]|nr:hypothetical protein [Cellvibrionales bacterium]